MIDINFHYIDKIYVATNETSRNGYFSIVLIDRDNNFHEITVFGDKKMTEVKFGEQE